MSFRPSSETSFAAHAAHCGLELLDEIPCPGFANAAHWRNYPRLVLSHPERNHPGAIAWLLGHYSVTGGNVWDPMCGAGTVLREAERIKLMRPFGWDIDPFWRGRLPESQRTPDERDAWCQLVITSPSYFGTNHHPGRSAAQERYSAKIGSRAGDHHLCEPIDGHLGQMKPKDATRYWATLLMVYESIRIALAPGAAAIVIVRDRIILGECSSYVNANRQLLWKAGLRIEGGHPRRLRPSARWQQREKLKPGQPFINVEWAIVARKEQ